MSTRDKILTFGMVCSIALLGFVAGAVVTGGYAFADIPSNLKSDVLAYNNDVAYVSLDSVDHIVIYMNDGSKKVGSASDADTGSNSVETSSNSTAAVKPADTLQVKEDYVASPPIGEQASNARAVAKSSNSSSATDLSGIPLPPAKSAASSGSSAPAASQVVVVPREVAAATQQTGTTVLQPNITIQNTQPEVKVLSQATPAANVSTVSTNYNYYDYITKNTQLASGSSLNNGTVVSIDYQAMVDKLVNSMKNSPDIAKQISNLPGLTINTNTVNNANNDGVIVQGSDNAKVVNVEDSTIGINTNIKDSFNKDSFNTTMDNVGNKVNENVGNTTNATTSTSINTNSNNTSNTNLQNVGNDNSQTSIDATVHKTVNDVSGSLNGANVVNSSNIDNSGIDTSSIAGDAIVSPGAGGAAPAATP